MKAHSFYTVSGACREDGSDWSNLEPLASDDHSTRTRRCALHAACALHVGKSALRLLLLLFNCSHTNLEPLALIFFFFFFIIIYFSLFYFIYFIIFNYI